MSSAEMAYSCGSTAAVRSNGGIVDVSQYVQISQNCSDCAVCIPKAAVQGLCPLGEYHYKYTVPGFEAFPIFRWVSIFATASFTVDITLVPTAELGTEYIMDLKVRANSL